MMHVEFDSHGNVSSWGTYNKETPTVGRTLVNFEKLENPDLLYYRDNSVYTYTQEQLDCKRRTSRFSDGYWSNNTMSWIDLRTPDTAWEGVRSLRGALLKDSDWTQLPDVPLETKEVWAIYRQALRDITEQADPFNIQWPTLP